MIEKLIKELQLEIIRIEDKDQKIDTINWVRQQIHEVSPLKNHPVDFVMWVRSDNVDPNDYNPNHVATNKFKALQQSIKASGYTMGIVGDKEEDLSNNLSNFLSTAKSFFVEIVDGFHRRKSERKNKEISKSTFGRVPVSFIRNEEKSKEKKMAATILHNEARGVHGIEAESKMIQEMIQMGLSDAEICVRLGKSADEVLILKQTRGLAANFENLEYTPSWEFKKLD